MKRLMTLGLGCAILAAPVYAALKTGAQAPDFSTEATLAGKPFSFSLAEALRSGPVVLYFYPAAFTPGCTVEAHEFAEPTDKFKALGATARDRFRSCCANWWPCWRLRRTRSRRLPRNA